MASSSQRLSPVEALLKKFRKQWAEEQPDDSFTLTKKAGNNPLRLGETSMPVFSGTLEQVIMAAVEERMSFVPSGSFIHVLGKEIVGPHKRSRYVHMGTIHKSRLSEYLSKLEVSVEFPTDPWKLGLMEEKGKNV